MRRRRGSGTVFKKGDLWIGRYWAEFSDGTKRLKQVSGRTKREAEQNLLAAPRMATPFVKVREFMQSWLDSHDVAPKTRQNYQDQLGWINERIGGKPLGELTVWDIESVIKPLGTSWAAKETHKVLKIALKTAEKRGLVTRNVALLADSPKYRAKPSERVYTSAELQSIIAMEPNPVYRVFYAFLWGTGARPWSEAAPLKWSDIVVDDGWWFRGAKTEAGGKLRPIPSWLYGPMEGIRAGEKVFRNVGTSRTSAAWREAQRKAGFDPVEIYSLRRSYATILSEKGDRMALAWNMGHTKPDTTEGIYVKADRKRMRKLVE